MGESKIITLRHLVDTIEQVLEKKAILNFLPMQQGDVSRTYADISKAKTEIGYHPEYDIETGIKEFVDWYKKSSTNL